MGFTENFKFFQKESGLSIVKIAKKLNVNRSTVSAWANSKTRTPSPDMINKIANVLGIEVEKLLGITINKTTMVRKIPIIGASSCGDPISDDYHGNEFAYYNGEFWTQKLYCVIACGDSMSPDIEDGDEVICDPERKPQHGDIVEYKIRNERAIKIYVEDVDANIIQLIPYNQSAEFKIRTIRLDDEEVNDLSISVVVAINKMRFHNRKARLKIIGRL
jgi:SOS-response transcriptional repressor LexA